MKKTICYFICALLVSLLFCSSVCSRTVASNRVDTNLTAEEFEGSAQYLALKAYFSLIKEFKCEDNPDRFIDGYAGCYIDKDNRLVICIKEDYQFLQQRLIECSAEKECILFQKSVYDYNELLSYASTTICDNKVLLGKMFCFDFEQNNICFFTDSSINPYINTIESYIDKKGFPIIIYVEEPKAMQENLQNTSVRSTAIHLEDNRELERYVNRSSIELTGGIPIFKKTNGSYSKHGTMGFSGTYGNATAYITAGHVVDSIDSWFVRQNDLINDYITYNVEECVNGLSGDYAIVTLSSNIYSISKSNQVRLSSSLTGTVSYYYNVSDEMPVGTLIYKYGTATGFTYGTYTQYCTSYYDNDQNFYIENVHGFYRYTSNGEFCDKGDSGGPVWLVCLNSRVLIGVISGCGIHNGNDVAYFASMDDFTSSGFVPYNLIEVDDDIWD